MDFPGCLDGGPGVEVDADLQLIGVFGGRENVEADAARSSHPEEDQQDRSQKDAGAGRPALPAIARWISGETAQRAACEALRADKRSLRVTAEDKYSSEGRNDRDRQDERQRKGDDHGDRHRTDELAENAGNERHRSKDGQRRERASEGGCPDPIECSANDSKAGGTGGIVIAVAAGVYRLADDDRVVNE